LPSAIGDDDPSTLFSDDTPLPHGRDHGDIHHSLRLDGADYLFKQKYSGKKITITYQYCFMNFIHKVYLVRVIIFISDFVSLRTGVDKHNDMASQ
jgi:hypothetical protein